MCNEYDLFSRVGIKLVRRKKKKDDPTKSGISNAPMREEDQRAADRVVEEFNEDFNLRLFPKRYAPVLIREGGEDILEDMRWGVFARIQGVDKFITNARNDKLLKSITWRYSVKTRRCLIPGSAYYEPGIGPPGMRGKVRFWVKDRPHFYFAGVWEENPEDPDAEKPRAFAMVTTEPNAIAAQFHDRMPLVLNDEEAAAWLGEEPLPDDQLTALCRGLPADSLLHEIFPAMPKPQKPPRPTAPPPNAQGELF